MKNFVFLGLFALVGCSASTESTEIGIRTLNLTVLGSRGVIEEQYPPGGTYFFPRVLSSWSVYDIGIQNLAMLRESNQGARQGDDSLRFKTVDGNDISVNVTIAWRIDPTKAAYVRQFIGGSTQEVERKFVRPVARTLVRDVLNQLTSEEYYRAERRFAMGEEARVRLNLVMEKEGVQIQQVLLGEHKFNPTYEQTIKDKKVAEQEAERLTSETEAAGAERLRDLERGKGTVTKAMEEALGEASKKKLKADAIYFERQQQAEAILSEKRARAEGLTARAKALAGSGGRNMVKLEVAKALNGKQILFMPAGSGIDLRKTDVNSLIQSYGVEAVSK